jgi:nucleoid DNA-binding protein
VGEGKMNQKEFIDTISEELAISKAESERLLNGILDKLSAVLLSKERVYFRSFGSFNQVLRPSKKFHNVNTGKIETRPAFYDIDFRPSLPLLKKLNKKPVSLSLRGAKATKQSSQKQKRKRKISLKNIMKVLVR